MLWFSNPLFCLSAINLSIHQLQLYVQIPHCIQPTVYWLICGVHCMHVKWCVPGNNIYMCCFTSATCPVQYLHVFALCVHSDWQIATHVFSQCRHITTHTHSTLGTSDTLHINEPIVCDKCIFWCVCLSLNNQYMTSLCMVAVRTNAGVMTLAVVIYDY